MLSKLFNLSNVSLRQTAARAYDMQLVALGAIILLALLALSERAAILAPLRLALGLAYALFVPGYCLIVAALPRCDQTDGAVRSALSLGASVGLLAGLMLLLDLLPWGIRPWPIALGIALWCVLMCGIVIWRRALLPTDAVPVAAAGGLLGAARSISSRIRMRHVGPALAVIGVLLLAGLAALIPDATGKMTEFYVLGKQSTAEDYPREVIVGEPMKATFGIANREFAAGDYRIEAWSNGALLAKAGPITLANGETREIPLRYTLSHSAPDQRIDVQLFYNDQPDPYRQLTLWVNVLPKQTR